MAYPQKITFGELRASGVRESGIEPGFVCTVCGHRGADVRPAV